MSVYKNTKKTIINKANQLNVTLLSKTVCTTYFSKRWGCEQVRTQTVYNLNDCSGKWYNRVEIMKILNDIENLVK